MLNALSGLAAAFATQNTKEPKTYSPNRRGTVQTSFSPPWNGCKTVVAFFPLCGSLAGV
jgi:hypothetical protein